MGVGEIIGKEMIESKCGPLSKEKVRRHRVRIVIVKGDEFKKYREW